MIQNCPVKKPNINLKLKSLIQSGFSQRTNDRPGQPEESGKPEVNQKQPYFRKLYIMSGPESDVESDNEIKEILLQRLTSGFQSPPKVRLRKGPNPSSKTISKLSFSPKTVSQNTKSAIFYLVEYFCQNLNLIRDK